MRLVLTLDPRDTSGLSPVLACQIAGETDPQVEVDGDLSSLIPSNVTQMINDIGLAIFPAISDTAAEALLEGATFGHNSQLFTTGLKTKEDVTPVLNKKGENKSAFLGEEGDCASPTFDEVSAAAQKKGDKIDKNYFNNTFKGSEDEFDR